MNLKTIYLVVFMSIIFLNLGYSQDQQKHEIKYHVGEDGKLYWNKKLPAYIRIASSPDDKGHLMTSEKQKVNPYFFDTEGLNKVRTKYATDPETKKTIVPHTEVLWEVYVDGSTPKSSIKFEKANRYFTSTTKYYGTELELNISTGDNLSGINQLFYSINNEAYKPYTGKIPVNTQGGKTVKFYAVDKVGNPEVSVVKKFIVDITPPKTFYNITGIAQNKVISVATQIYLDPTDSVSGVAKTLYTIDKDSTELRYIKGKSIPIAHLSDGDHKITYYSIDNVGNIEPKTVIDFYLDKTAPIMAADILGDRYMAGDQVFFSGRTKMKLTAVDNKAGVKKILFSIDGKEFNTYKEPFYLPSVPGVHVVKYYAVDNMENQTKKDGTRYRKYKHVVSRAYVDLSGPLLSHHFLGTIFKARDTVFVNKNTRIKFTAVDKESGLQSITYSIDGNREEIRYIEPFGFEKEGLHRIEYFGYDNVNNRNRADFFIYLDKKGPKITHSFNIEAIDFKDGLSVYPPYTILYLAATDEVIGAKYIYYKVNNGREIEYSKYIKGFRKNTVNTVKIRAVDYLKNETELTIKFYVK